MRPQTLEECRDAILSRGKDPGPYITSECFLDLIERVLVLEKRVADLQELARTANRPRMNVVIGDTGVVL